VDAKNANDLARINKMKINISKIGEPYSKTIEVSMSNHKDKENNIYYGVEYEGRIIELVITKEELNEILVEEAFEEVTGKKEWSELLDKLTIK
jgi:hypothetical protein